MIHGICSPFEASVSKNETLNFSLLGNNIMTENCNCVIHDPSGNSTITIVDYR